MKKNSTIIFSIIAAFCGVLLLSACNRDGNKKPGLEFMPDMYRSPGYETYAPSPITQDSISALQPVAGTIARGQYIGFNYPNTNEGYEAAGLELKNPLESTPANLEEGKRKYTIFCAHCHGEKGDGQGWLSIKGDKFPVINYFDNTYKDLPDGKMFFSITYGKNLMGSHASQVSATDRWKIITYINKLQDDGLAAATPAPAADSTATAAK